MLTIDRQPVYKNKLLLSSMAVVIGFGATVGLLRVISPADTGSNQSAQTSRSDRASGLIPIKSDESESQSEGGDTAKSDGQASGDPSALPGTSTSAGSGGATWQPSSSGTATSGTSSQPSGSSTSSSSSGTSSTPPAQTQPAPQPSQPPAQDPKCLLNLADVPLLCS